MLEDSLQDLYFPTREQNLKHDLLSRIFCMKIVLLTSRFPYPLEKGDKLRVYNFIRQLSIKNEIILVAVNAGEVSRENYLHMKQYCSEIHLFRLSKLDLGINLIRAGLNGLPFQVGIFYKRKITSDIQKIINDANPDAVFCHLIRMSEYVKEINKYTKTLDYMDAFSKGIERWSEQSTFFLKKSFLQNEHKRLVKYEREVFDKFDRKIIISEQDRTLIPHSEREKIAVIPNGVDTEQFYPLEIEKKYDLLFTGNMGYPPNVESALYTIRNIFPEVRKKIPEINLLVAGINSPGELKDSASGNIHVIEKFSHIREAFAQCRIMLAPMLISIGLQNKILQAMAMKIPVICSPLANNAVKAPVNKCILEAESVEEYTEKIRMVLSDRKFAETLTENAFDFVIKNYNWKKISEKLESIICSN